MTDAAGQPVANARIELTLQRHAYGFGTYLDTAALGDTADHQRYREEILKRFNLVALPMFWVDWGWGEKANRAQWLALADWATQAGLRRRATNMIIPGWRWSPSWLRKLEDSPRQLEQVLTASIIERLALFARFEAKEIDAFSELRANHEFVDLLGPDILKEWLGYARHFSPRARLTLNEDTILSQGGHTEHNQDVLQTQLESLNADERRIDVLGFECHFDEELTPPDEIVKILDRFAQYGLPIAATELIIVTDDEAAQADYMRDFLTVFFSHPATSSIIQWGFWEGQHWYPKAALFRPDWSAKPALTAYDDLVLGKWRTHLTRRTDAAGTLTGRGFKGDYQLRVTTPDGHTTEHTVNIPADAAVNRGESAE